MDGESLTFSLNFPNYMNCKYALVCSQDSGNGPSQLKSVHMPFSKIRFNINLPYTPGSLKWSVPFPLKYQKSVYGHCNPKWWKVQGLKHFVTSTQLTHIIASAFCCQKVLEGVRPTFILHIQQCQGREKNQKGKGSQSYLIISQRYKGFFACLRSFLFCFSSTYPLTSQNTNLPVT
jgi:hypothetical protein